MPCYCVRLSAVLVVKDTIYALANVSSLLWVSEKKLSFAEIRTTGRSRYILMLSVLKHSPIYVRWELALGRYGET
jgi:hypothetical protein